MTGIANSPLERLAELLADASNLGTAPTTEAGALHAVEIGNHIERAARAHLEDSVAVARARGVSWQDIGNAFGITRQAAFKRFGTVSTATPGEGTMGNPIIDLTSRTEEVFGHISKDDYGSVKSMMTFTCSRALTKKKLMGAWAQVVAGVIIEHKERGDLRQLGHRPSRLAIRHTWIVVGTPMVVS